MLGRRSMRCAAGPRGCCWAMPIFPVWPTASIRKVPCCWKQGTECNDSCPARPVCASSKVKLDVVEKHCRVPGAGQCGLLLVGTRHRRDAGLEVAGTARGDIEACIRGSG